MLIRRIVNLAKNGYTSDALASTATSSQRFICASSALVQHLMFEEDVYENQREQLSLHLAHR